MRIVWPNGAAADRKVTYYPAILMQVAAPAAGLTLATESVADVVVGTTRKIEIPRQAAPTGDQMRAAYRRPKTTPFPADTPYTVEKATLGKNSTSIRGRSELIKPLGLTEKEKADLVAFMKTLTSDVDPTVVPVLPR